MKKIFLLFLVLSLASMGTLFALDIRINEPKFLGDHPDIPEINAEIRREFDDLERELRAELGALNTNPQKLIGAFANSSVFASNGATNRGYGGYKTFAFSVGSKFGMQLPEDPRNFIDDFEEKIDNLFADSDIAFGANAQILNAQLGINTSFLLDGLYLGLKFGYINMPIDVFHFNTLSAGATANYQLIKRKSLPLGVIQWRGINIGTGFIMQNSKLSMDLPLETEYNDGVEKIEIAGEEISVNVEGNMHVNFNINTYTIPLEVMTSIRLFWFLNLAAGVGVDIGFGNAHLDVGGSIVANFYDLPEDITQKEPGSMIISMGGNAGPTLFNPKLIGGLGFSLGPVILDIPFTYYPLDHGYNLGITLGIVF